MAKAYFCDGRIEDREMIGEYETLEAAKQACLDHAQTHPHFIEILAADDDEEENGFDMAVHFRANRIRLYSADA